MANMDIKTIVQTVKNLNGWEQKMADRFLGYMRGNQAANVHSIFFEGYPVRALPDGLAAYAGAFAALAKVYICGVIADIQDYQLSRMVSSSSYLQTEWERQLRAASGAFWEGLAMDTLEDILPQVVNEPTAYAGPLAEQMKRAEWIQGMMVEGAASIGAWRLLWLLEKRLDSGLAQELINAWNDAGCGEMVNEFSSYPWYDCVRIQLSPGTNLFQAVKADIRIACEKQKEIGREVVSDLAGQTSSGAPVIKKYELVRYQSGIDVSDWIQQQSGYFSGQTGEFPTNAVKKPYDPFGCVLRGTRVLDAKKHWIPMELLKEGDELLSAKMLPSNFSGELVENEQVARLYAVNNDEPFMSLDHMILTENGYKCPDPEAARRWNPNLQVSKLELGDVVLKYELSIHNELLVRRETVKRINIVPNSRACVDIHICDGYKSYITEYGYVCYANYPEITAERILSKLQQSEAPQALTALLQQNRSVMEDIFGERELRYMENKLQNMEERFRLVPHRCTDRELYTMKRLDLQVDAGNSPGFSALHLMDGCLFMDDGSQGPVPCTIHKGSCFWRRILENGREEKGCLRLYEQGFYGEAVVLRDGVAERFHLVATSAYRMKVCSKDQPGEDFGSYRMGFEKKDGRFIPVGEWSMLYPDESGKMMEGTAASSANQDISYFVDKSHNLKAKVKFPCLTQYQYPLLHQYQFEQAELIFDWAFSTVKGTASAKDPEKKTSLEGILEPEQQAKLQEFQLQVNSMPRSVSAAFSSHELLELENCLGRSTLELFNLPQPEDMSQVHQQCFQKLLKMTAHAAHKSGNEIKDYLGLGIPTVSDAGGDLSCAQAKLAEENAAFLLDGLGTSYLSYAYSQSSQEQIRKPIVNIPLYNEKIKYYMQGKDKGCMSQTQAYQKLTNPLYRQVYISNVAGLDEYVAEQKTHDWAKELYMYCNSPEILNGLILTNLVDPENTRINHLCSILDALDQRERVSLEINAEPDNSSNAAKLFSFSVALRKQVTDLTFKYAVKNIKLPDKDDEESKEAFNQTLVAFMQTYFKNLESHLFADWNSEIYDEAYKELQEAAEEAGYDTVEKYITNITEVVADITATLIAMESPDMPTAIVKFFDSHPKVSRVVCAGFYIMGIASLIFGFREWSRLTPVERGELITGAVAIGLQVINDLSAWKACGVFKQAFGNLQAADSQIFKVMSQADFVKALARSDDMEAALTKLGVDSANLSTRECDMMAAASKWMKISRIGAVAAKVASALLLAAVLAFQVLETVKDFHSGQPAAVEVLDIIQAVSNGICFLAEAGAGIMALCSAQVCSVIPVVGVIFAVVGIIASIVALFIKRKEPETPVEKFIREKCVPFIEKQSPTREWIEEQKKIAQHLSGDRLPQEAICV